MNNWTFPRVVAGAAIAMIALVAGYISYWHIVALSLAVGQTPQAAHLMPFAVDGLIAAGSVILLTATAGHWWLGWLCIVPGVAATLFANAESGVAHGPLGELVASWPAIAFSLASFALERWIKGHLDHPVPVVATCGHNPAGVAEDDVKTAYLHGRDCLGAVPSVRGLSAVYGLSRPRVAELVGPLNGGVPA